MIAQHPVRDHLVHFYHLAALDWVDIVSALQADPSKAAQLAQSLSPWPGNSATEFKAVQDRLKAFVDGGKLGIFASGYWDHPAMRLAPEVNLLAVAHYLKAFDYQRKAAQAVAILGGKNPHIQNLVVGGVATAINLDNLATLNLERLAFMRTLMEEARDFVQQVYYPDLLAIAAAYKDWFAIGAGVTNYLAVPEFPEDTRNTRFGLTGGVITNGDLQNLRPLKTHQDDYLLSNIQESVARAWYRGTDSLHPWKGVTSWSAISLRRPTAFTSLILLLLPAPPAPVSATRRKISCSSAFPSNSPPTRSACRKCSRSACCAAGAPMRFTCSASFPVPWHQEPNSPPSSNSACPNWPSNWFQNSPHLPPLISASRFTPPAPFAPSRLCCSMPCRLAATFHPLPLITRPRV
jgi:hypothetical protein